MYCQVLVRVGVNFIYRLVTPSFHILFPRAPLCVNLTLHSFGPQHVWSFVATAGREKVFGVCLMYLF